MARVPLSCQEAPELAAQPVGLETGESGALGLAWPGWVPEAVVTHQLGEGPQGLHVAGVGSGAGQPRGQGVPDGVGLLGGRKGSAWHHAPPRAPRTPRAQSRARGRCLAPPHEPRDQGLPLPSTPTARPICPPAGTLGRSHHKAPTWGTQEGMPGPPKNPAPHTCLLRPPALGMWGLSRSSPRWARGPSRGPAGSLPPAGGAWERPHPTLLGRGQMEVRGVTRAPQMRCPLWPARLPRQACELRPGAGPGAGGGPWVMQPHLPEGVVQPGPPAPDPEACSGSLAGRGRGSRLGRPWGLELGAWETPEQAAPPARTRALSAPPPRAALHPGPGRAPHWPRSDWLCPALCTHGRAPETPPPPAHCCTNPCKPSGCGPTQNQVAPGPGPGPS